MRGEDRPEQPEGVSPRRVRTGPRHAAPKKSVLTRLQVPAGKAIALAAMPTAVLMGMGLTPQLASASPRPEDRYKAGPCVSQPDEADKEDAKGEKDASESKPEEKNAKDAKDAADSKGSSEKGSKGSEESSDGQGTSREDKAAPTTSPSGSPSAPSSDAGEEPKEPSVSPSPSKSKNPLDPLGLGDALHDILTPEEKAEQESAEPSGSPSPSSSASPSSSPSPSRSSGSKSSDQPADPVKDTVDKVGKGVKDTVDEVGKTVDDAKDKADKALPKPSPSASKGEGGKEAFPCPEFDADAYDNAETDPTANLLPEDPWTLKSTLLTLHGLDYAGIVEVKTQGGQIKKVLKFTASAVDIKDLHQLVVGPAGTTTHVQAREGSTSTIRNGTVTMYTEELKGNLLGLIPITFSPKSPPPVNIPEVFFTDVTVKQAGQFGGDLTVPGMHLFKTGE